MQRCAWSPRVGIGIGIALALVAAACGGSHVMAEDDQPFPDDGGAAGSGEPGNLAGITLYHNQIRAMVDTTGNAAGPLPMLAWDAALAATAAAWVAQCKDTDGNGLVDHDDGRSDGHAFYVGENIYASSGAASAHDAVFAWFDEAAHYHYATNACDGGEVCGHYTQVVWRATQKLGCALGRCAGLRFPSTIVCDYGPGGNIDNQAPY